MKTNFVLLVAVLVLVGCASAPTLGDKMIETGIVGTNIGEKWNDGNEMTLKGVEMVSDGEKMIKKGKDQIRDGEDLIEDGKKKIKKGNELIEEGKDITRESEDLYNTIYPKQ